MDGFGAPTAVSAPMGGAGTPDPAVRISATHLLVFQVNIAENLLWDTPVLAEGRESSLPLRRVLAGAPGSLQLVHHHLLSTLRDLSLLRDAPRRIRAHRVQCEPAEPCAHRISEIRYLIPPLFLGGDELLVLVNRLVLLLDELLLLLKLLDKLGKRGEISQRGQDFRHRGLDDIGGNGTADLRASALGCSRNRKLLRRLSRLAVRGDTLLPLRRESIPEPVLCLVHGHVPGKDLLEELLLHLLEDL